MLLGYIMLIPRIRFDSCVSMKMSILWFYWNHGLIWNCGFRLRCIYFMGVCLCKSKSFYVKFIYEINFKSGNYCVLIVNLNMLYECNIGACSNFCCVWCVWFPIIWIVSIEFHVYNFHYWSGSWGLRPGRLGCRERRRRDIIMDQVWERDTNKI